MPDVAVVGGGLLGSCVAYELVRAGREVVLLEGDKPGQATAAGAGILSPATSQSGDDADHEFGLQAGAYYTTLLDELRADDAGDGSYERCGVLVVAGEGDSREAFREQQDILLARQAAQESLPRSLREISSTEAIERYPLLERVLGAILDENGARVDGMQLNADIQWAAQARGLRIVHEAVERILVSHGVVQGVATSVTNLSADAVVLATGAWTSHFDSTIGLDNNVVPMRGQIVHLRHTEYPTTGGWPAVVGVRGKYMVPWPNGRIVVGATREQGSGFEPHLTESGQEEVMSEALRLSPGLSNAQVLEWRVGLRPVSSDDHPLLGVVPGLEGCFLATGHGAGGLLGGPYSARLLADYVITGMQPEQMRRYDPARFTRSADPE
jgi:D-amino-acid dehydrogenase